MRENLPVTNRECDFPADATLMSTTDPQSRITYANDAFISVSGFTREEIHGSPHNMVRHPDMPVEAFADMWATLKAGEPWTALVKNRRKNGDHYWVRANATPVAREGRITGYMSVRTKPTREEISSSEALYAKFRSGNRERLRFNKGLIERTGLLGLSSAMQTMSVRWRIWSALLASGVALTCCGWLFGLKGMALAEFVAAVCVCYIVTGGWLHKQVSRPLAQMLD